MSSQPQLARVIPRAEHSVSRSQLSPDAVRVLYRLKEAGFQAFLVGGCVRDVLLGIQPKDFDVATDAHPEEVRRLFRNCRLIGRRFRLAHVFFGREIIEVATFRAQSAPPPGAEIEDPEDIDDDDGEGDDAPAPLSEAARFQQQAAAAAGHDHSHINDDDDDDDFDRSVDVQGRILRDNVYGTIDDDVWRRDFTANALYYNIADFSIWDYTSGLEDIQARRLRLIGDPETRYREDPVRMLRAARFEAKLGFTLEPGTAAPIATLRDLLADVPPARLFEETLKLFLGGHGARSLAVLRQHGLLGALLPPVAACLERFPGSPIEQLLIRGLENTDARVAADKPVTPGFLFALLLYGPVGLEIEKAPEERWTDLPVIFDAVDAAVRAVQKRVSLPRRFSLGVRDMFALQPRLEVPRGRRALRTLEHPRFRAAFDLLALRADCGMASAETVAWWTALQEAAGPQREQLAEASGNGQGGGGGNAPRGGSGRSSRGRRRRGGRTRSTNPGG